MNVKYDFSVAPLSNERVRFFMSTKSNYSKFPNEFFEEPLNNAISITAKVLYTRLSARLELSEKNKAFQDKDGTPFIYYTVEELAHELGCGITTIKKSMKELEDIGLINRVRQYACKANKIYVHSVQRGIKHCGTQSVPQSDAIRPTVGRNPSHSRTQSVPQSDAIRPQSISQLTNQKNQIKRKSQMYQEPVPQNEYNSDYNDNSDFDFDDYELEQELQKQRDEQEEQRKQQKAEETKKLLINHFAEVFDKINADESELLLKVLYDVYTSNRPTYTIKGKDIPRNDVSRKIFMNHWTKVLRAVQSIAEVREKKYIENEFMYLLTILYSC